MLLLLLGCAAVCRSMEPLRDIHDIHELMAWHDEAFTSSTTVTANIRLMGDLVFDTTTSQKMPLGREYKTAFRGIFDGNGHTVSGLTVSTADGAGLFERLVDATVKNLVIGKTCSFVSTSGDAGGLSALARGDVFVQNIVNEADVKGTRYVGGLFGQVSTGTISITAFKNTGDISSERNENEKSTYSGGMIGYMGHGTATINGCTNMGNVTAANMAEKGDAFSGGIIGRSNAFTTVERTMNTGNISAESTIRHGYAGGIVGYTSTENATLKSCTNSGNIASKGSQKQSYSGGIVGYSEDTLG